MNWYKDTLQIQTQGKGLYPFTRLIQNKISNWDIEEGMCYLYVQHTSASLVINENYDPSAKVDMEKFMEVIAPEKLSWYQHTLEGADDSPAHIRSMITQVSITIPIDHGRLSLGTWQGVYLFEHRKRKQHREVLLRCLSIV